MKYALMILASIMVMAAGVSVAVAGNGHGGTPPGQGECSHGNSNKPCKDDPNPEHGKDCEEHGKYGGVNEDHCTPTTTIPTTTIPTTPTPTTPSTHDCTYTGAGKDGQKDAYGGTNDDCAPLPTTPTEAKKVESVKPVVCPAPSTIIKIVKKTIVKWKTKVKVVYKTKTKVIVKVKKVKVYVPGLHPDGAEGSG